MPTTTTKRAKLKAMAEQTASPEEAKVAQTMLAKTAATPEQKLEVIHDDIMSSWSKGIEEEFRIGGLLRQAADLLDPTARTQGADGKVTGSPFGDWFRAQDFPFSMKTAQRLRVASEREPEVRALIAAKTGRDMGVNTAVALLLAPPRKGTGEALPITDATPADPAYDAIRTAHRLLVTEGGYANLHIDDLAKVAGFIKDLAAGYTEEKGRRAA